MRPLTLLFTAMLLLLPALSDARPGMGQSLGSRGSMTYSSPQSTGTAPYGASPFQRSMTPNGSSYGSSYANGYGGYGAGYGRSSMGSMLMGGLIGAGIGGMLFGHGFFGFHGGFGFLGLLLQLFLLYMLAKFLLRQFFGAPALAGAGGLGRTMFQPRAMPPGGQRAAGLGFGGAARQPITIGPSDYQAFEALLKAIQAAWSAHDMNNLAATVTPEMLGYFNEQISEQSSRGVRNIVSDVRLQQGDLSEAWAEGNRAYATVAMRFSMIDVTRDSAGRVVDGSPTERVTVTEFWTFLRSKGGRWVLSAFQQAR
jgi:predicted lipid-binding transport protein (Tim44 family)